MKPLRSQTVEETPLLYALTKKMRDIIVDAIIKDHIHPNQVVAVVAKELGYIVPFVDTGLPEGPVENRLIYEMIMANVASGEAASVEEMKVGLHPYIEAANDRDESSEVKGDQT